jgi:hypothetical protein
VEQTTDPYPSHQHRPEPAFLVGIGYGLLAVLGLVLGIFGSFEYSWEIGDVPVAAVLLSVLNLVVFRAAGWAMESKLGAAVPALPWLVILFVLAGRRPEGDLVVTGTAPGSVYMVGGAIAAVVAVAWTRQARPLAPGGAPLGSRVRG